MHRTRPEYRKALHSGLKREWYNVPKIEGGPYWPTCNCCNGIFGKPHGNNKRLIHRYIRHRATQVQYDLD
jgi:hypothetical protein